MPVTKGQYKYSILAAAFDKGPNGWQKTKDAYKAASGQLEGYLNVYQAVDFTNMGADTLTITGTSSSVTYADMKPCNVTSFKDGADPTKACTVYSIVGATVESKGWSGTYSFPSSYNLGSWSQASAATDVVP